MDIEQIIVEWHDSRWGDKEDRIVAAKLAEETGEVCGAYIKEHEGRMLPQDIKDELGDLLIVASVLAGRRGWTLAELRDERFATVMER